MDKKKLYESIMASVAKEVKKALNEGAWGCHPSQSDDYLDECSRIGRQFIKIIIDNFEKAIKEEDYQQIWNYMGIITDYLRTEDLTGECMFWEDNEELYTILNKGEKSEEKRLNNGVKLNQLYNQAYEMLNDDNNSFAKDWKDPAKFKQTLQEIKKQFDEMMLERKSDEFGKDSWHNKIDKIRKDRDKLFYKYTETKGLFAKMAED